MPKRRSSDVVRTEWKVSLPATVAARVEMTFYNPVTGKPDYGARSQLIERLLVDYLNRVEKQPLTPVGEPADA